jgi:hypothetical protein
VHSAESLSRHLNDDALAADVNVLARLICFLSIRWGREIDKAAALGLAFLVLEDAGLDDSLGLVLEGAEKVSVFGGGIHVDHVDRLHLLVSVGTLRSVGAAEATASGSAISAATSSKA